LKEKNKSILIISVPRTGSTSLCNAFGKSLKEIQEPLNTTLLYKKSLDTKTFNRVISQKNIVVKTMADHIPTDWKESHISFLENICKKFEYVILLDRKNTNQQLKSYNKLLSFLSKDKNQKDFTKKSIKIMNRFIYLQKFLIRELAARLNKKIYYYEDIFFGNHKKMLEEIGLDEKLLDLRYLDSKYKYKENLFRIELPKDLI